MTTDEETKARDAVAVSREIWALIDGLPPPVIGAALAAVVAKHIADQVLPTSVAAADAVRDAALGLHLSSVRHLIPACLRDLAAARRGNGIKRPIIGEH